MDSRRQFLRRANQAGLGTLLAGAGLPRPQAPGVWRDVRAFGAVGDGRTDDTAAFQAALEDGSAIRVPPGTYRITEPLRRLETRTVIRGAGPATRLVFRSAGSLFETAPSSEYVEIGGCHAFLTAEGSRFLHLRNSHYARLFDLSVFGTGQSAASDQVGFLLDAPYPPGGYWAQGSDILLRGLQEGFRLVNGANATTWLNVTVRQTWLPVNILSGYGFQLIGGSIEGWGGSGTDPAPAIHAGDHGGVLLGMVFEETKPSGAVVRFDGRARGWVIMGRFNIAGRITVGDAGRNLIVDTYNHRATNVAFRGGGNRRPANPVPYEAFFDTELNRPIWWTGSDWVDASGRPV